MNTRACAAVIADIAGETDVDAGFVVVVTATATAVPNVFTTIVLGFAILDVNCIAATETAMVVIVVATAFLVLCLFLFLPFRADFNQLGSPGWW